jgi:hypothetical protein
MRYTVFYSWQSDLENKHNRSFIQEVLEKAIKAVSKNSDFRLDAVVDRDTYGIPGSPSIVESITGKIARSDVFVCDISIINALSSGRTTPNPNVLYELGFASAILGWERIIMIQNSVYGGPEMLPFDLRGRRILQYYLDSTVDDRAGEKQKLQKSLVGTFTNALQYYSGYSTRNKDKAIWWGTWTVDETITARGGVIKISRVSSDAFFFRISIYDGARTGEVLGKAQILTPHSAYSRIKTFDGKDCEIVFRRRLENGTWCIEVEEGEGCRFFHGHNATFSNTYKHSAEALINNGYLDEIDLLEIQRLIGKHLQTFLNNFQQIFEDESEERVRVISGGVKGLYSIMESILVLDSYGGVWGAFKDLDDNVVRYFSNLKYDLTGLPDSVREWISRFPNPEKIQNDQLQATD